VTERGFVPAAKGEPATGVKAPVPALMAYAETLLEPEFATYANAPSGDTVTEKGFVPAAKGEPATGVNAPVPPLMVNAETLLELKFAT